MAKGRPKGGTNKYWSAEEKYKVIKPILDYKLTSGEVTRRTGINNGLLSTWVRKYKENGLKGLENKRKPGNPLAKIYSKKNFKNREWIVNTFLDNFYKDNCRRY